jgi:hypothetical protein
MALALASLCKNLKAEQTFPTLEEKAAMDNCPNGVCRKLDSSAAGAQSEAIYD